MQLQEDLLSEITTELNQEQVSRGIRFADYLIDLVMFYLVLILVFIILRQLLVNENSAMVYFITYIVYLSYYTILEGAAKGQTIGKMITGSRVVKEDGSPASWKDAFLRSLCRIVPFEPFSALGDRPWHDRWTNTKVVKSKNQMVY